MPLTAAGTASMLEPYALVRPYSKATVALVPLANASAVSVAAVSLTAVAARVSAKAPNGLATTAKRSCISMVWKVPMTRSPVVSAARVTTLGVVPEATKVPSAHNT